MLYTSVDNKKIKDLKKLNTKKYRDKTGLFLVEGEHLVLEAYKTGYLRELLLEKDTLFPLDVETNYLANNVIHYISELETPSNVMGICEKKRETPSLGNRLLILENIQDPGNLGTIIRSAVAFHIDTIIVSPNTVDLYNQKTIRATQGLLFHQNVIERDLLLEIPKLKESGYEILGTRVTHGMSIRGISKEKFALVMGNEGQGISDEVAELCDMFLYIDMDEACESLNVGVATSIILYELDK